MGFPGGSVVKNLPADVRDAGDTVSVPESERCPGEGNDNPLQYSYLGNPMDREAWQATAHVIVRSWTRLSAHAVTGKRFIFFNCSFQVCSNYIFKYYKPENQTHLEDLGLLTFSGNYKINFLYHPPTLTDPDSRHPQSSNHHVQQHS